MYEGRASLPVLSAMGLDRFQKAFFLHPKTYHLMGRVLINYGVVGDTLYPLYFEADVQRLIVPSEASGPMRLPLRLLGRT